MSEVCVRQIQDSRQYSPETGTCTSTHLVPQFIEPGIIIGAPLLHIVVLQRVALH